MIFLTKLTSIGLTSLSASGLSAYFIPKYLEGSESNLVYENNELTELDSAKFFRLIETEKELLERLKTRYAKFREALKGVEEAKGKAHGEVEVQLQKVAKEEQELEKIYRGVQDMISKLGKLDEQQARVLNNKLNVETAIEVLKYYNDALLKTGTALTQWGNSVNQIICLIKDSTAAQDCSKAGNWLIGFRQSGAEAVSVENSDEGGGTPASQAAKDQLTSSKENLQRQLNKIKQFIGQNASQHLWRQYQEISYKKLKENLKTLSDMIKKISEEQGKQLNTKVEEGKSKTEGLNDSYQLLQNTYNKWETLKRGESIIHNWSGQLQSSICNSLWNQDKELCILNNSDNT